MGVRKQAWESNPGPFWIAASIVGGIGHVISHRGPPIGVSTYRPPVSRGRLTEPSSLQLEAEVAVIAEVK